MKNRFGGDTPEVYCDTRYDGEFGIWAYIGSVEADIEMLDMGVMTLDRFAEKIKENYKAFSAADKRRRNEIKEGLYRIV
jgi:hypothetical protein